ncbi:MAG: phosphate ABC transporter permease PstA [Actinomycetota bacterium]
MSVALQRPPLGTTKGLSVTRRVKDASFTAFLACCSGLALLPLVVITVFVIRKGLPAISLNLFTQVPAGPLDPSSGGIAEAFVGSMIIVGIALLISVPLGIATAVYLAEYGTGRAAGAIRFTVDVLLATPSIIAGLVIAATLVTWMHTYSGIAGSVAISVLMWPVIARASEEVLRLVSDDVREAGLALGMPRSRVIMRIVIPSAGAGILTAVMLAVARGLGETAPILLTALGSDYMNTDARRPMDAIPLKIYAYARQPLAPLKDVAWGAALSLLLVVLILSISARFISARRRERLS